MFHNELSPWLIIAAAGIFVCNGFGLNFLVYVEGRKLISPVNVATLFVGCCFVVLSIVSKNDASKCVGIAFASMAFGILMTEVIFRWDRHLRRPRLESDLTSFLDVDNYPGR